MKIFNKIFQCASAVALSSAVLSGCSSNNDSNSSTVSSGNGETPIEQSCFWVGPYSKDITETNFAFPDDGARYWHSGYTIHAGATLKLNGEFPHARYMSINSYFASDTQAINFAAPAHAIADSAIVPNVGAENPNVNGANRNSEFRTYEITLAEGATPESVPNNTVYSNADLGAKTVIIYRVYVPDKGQNI